MTDTIYKLDGALDMMSNAATMMVVYGIGSSVHILGAPAHRVGNLKDVASCGT